MTLDEKIGLDVIHGFRSVYPIAIAELKDFSKVELATNETEQVKFCLEILLNIFYEEEENEYTKY
jgi:hypothetical protein